jgi:hypothetical protein
MSESDHKEHPETEDLVAGSLGNTGSYIERCRKAITKKIPNCCTPPITFISWKKKQNAGGGGVCGTRDQKQYQIPKKMKIRMLGEAPPLRAYFVCVALFYAARFFVNRLTDSRKSPGRGGEPNMPNKMWYYGAPGAGNTSYSSKVSYDMILYHIIYQRPRIQFDPQVFYTRTFL